MYFYLLQLPANLPLPPSKKFNLKKKKKNGGNSRRWTRAGAHTEEDVATHTSLVSRKRV